MSGHKKRRGAMKRILVLDDQEKIQQVYKRKFEREGFEVLTAGNAIEANDIVSRKKIDILLLDINMPEINGQEFFTVIYALHPGVRVIVTSVYPYEDQKQMIKEADDYFDKAESLDVLKAKVMSLVRAK
jgi:DNA-binding response OmpR family regulator